MGILDRKKALFEDNEKEEVTSPYKINSTFLKYNCWEESYRELMVSYLPMLPLLEENIVLDKADYILFEHCYARINDMSDIVLSELQYIDKRRKPGAKIIVVGKATNIEKKIGASIPDIIYIPSHFTEALGKMFHIDMKEEYFVYDDELDQLNIWPVDGCKRKCKFCRRSYMEIPFESLPLEYLKQQLDYFKKYHPEQMKHVSLRAENLTEYLDGENGLEAVIDLLDSYDEIETIKMPIGTVISEINDKILASLCRCKKLVGINLNYEVGTNHLLNVIGKSHTVERAIEISHILREFHPNLYIGTTVMVGLPEEEISDIYALADLLIECHPDEVLVNYYGMTPEQPLAQLPQLSQELKEEHLKLLRQRIFERSDELDPHRKMLVHYPMIYTESNKSIREKTNIEEMQKSYDGSVYWEELVAYIGKEGSNVIESTSSKEKSLHK